MAYYCSLVRHKYNSEGYHLVETKIIVLYNLEMSLVVHEYELLHVVEPGNKPAWNYYLVACHSEQIMRFDGIKATPSSCKPLSMMCI